MWRMYESAGQIRNLLGRKIKMKIRKLETGEKLNTRKLYEEVFSEDSKDFVDYYYEEKVKDNQIYVVEEDGEIQAMLHLNPYELAVNGSRKDVNYIVAVATRKSYRKRLAARLWSPLALLKERRLKVARHRIMNIRIREVRPIFILCFDICPAILPPAFYRILYSILPFQERLRSWFHILFCKKMVDLISLVSAAGTYKASGFILC